MVRQRKALSLKQSIYLLSILVLCVCMVHTTKITNAQTSSQPWALKLQVLSENNSTSTTFHPFDLVELRATVTYNNVSQPDTLVSFKLTGPSNDSIKISRIEITNTNGQAGFSFRLPINVQNQDAIIGLWNATATINGAPQQSVSFTTKWGLEITSLEIQAPQNRTILLPGDQVGVKLAISNQGGAGITNVTFDMRDSKSQLINETQVLNSQIANSNQTLVQTSIQIPEAAVAGQASITVALSSGKYNGTDIPAAKNRTFNFTIENNSTITPSTTPTFSPSVSPTPTPSTSASTLTPTPTPTVAVENSVSLFSWLLVATGFFTFTLLLAFLRRKPTQIGLKIPNIPMTTQSPTVTSLNEPPLQEPNTQQPTLSKLTVKTPLEKTIQATNPTTPIALQNWSATEIFGKEDQISSQIAQPRTIAEHLEKISDTGKKIQEIETELKVERQKLTKESAELNKTLEEQERILKSYFDSIKQTITKLDQPPNDKQDPQTNQKKASENTDAN